MAVDDDRFHQMFFEEGRELLVSLEEGLVELEQRQDDRAHIDRTFRAAHSIKGAAAMVGLAALAEFTNGIEAVLDRIRAGKLAVDSEIITTLLEAKDHLSAMIEAEAAKAPIAASTELNHRLESLLPESQVPRAHPSSSPALSEAVHQTEGVIESTGTRVVGSKQKSSNGSQEGVGSPEEISHYRIRLKPGPDMLRRGINPLGVLDELKELGRTVVRTDPALIPPLDEIDPERCYLVWDLDVETTADPQRLEDVFLFVAMDSTVAVDQILPDGSVVHLPIGSHDGLGVPAVLPSHDDPVVPTSTLAPLPPAKPSVPLAMVHQPPRMATRIRVDAIQLDDLVGLAGELAVLSDNLQNLRDMNGVQPWLHTLEALERVSRQIRDTTLDLRMVPVDELFSRFPRVVRDLADRSGKEIELRISGQETRLDRTIVERLGEPMIHLIRNAVDHALETPQERLARGKTKTGRITLMAGHEGDRVAIRVSDDGRGLDRERIARKGMALGLMPVGTSPADPRVDSLIFEPGFSTRDQVSELSGRGVGLDVVRDAVRGLRGSLAVESEPGKGTSFIFRLPLTLALIDGLLVESGGSRYVVPLAQVEECVSLSGSKPALSKGRPCVSVRGELVPMVPLRNLFRVEGPPPTRQELLLTRHAGQRVGVAVDRLLGRVQAVIQALGEGLASLHRFSGATILGDGSVSLILDLAALVSESRAADIHTTPPGVKAEGF